MMPGPPAENVDGSVHAFRSTQIAQRVAVSTAVSCQTLPTPFKLPM
jgi:hypothetical protein